MSDLILSGKQSDDLTEAHADINAGIETLRILVDELGNRIHARASDKGLADAYPDRIIALHFVISAMERSLEDADEIVAGDCGFRATRNRNRDERAAPPLNGGGAHV
jgi:hypothetical protein